MEFSWAAIWIVSVPLLTRGCCFFGFAYEFTAWFQKLVVERVRTIEMETTEYKLRSMY